MSIISEKDKANYLNKIESNFELFVNYHRGAYPCLFRKDEVVEKNSSNVNKIWERIYDNALSNTLDIANDALHNNHIEMDDYLSYADSYIDASIEGIMEIIMSN